MEPNSFSTFLSSCCGLILIWFGSLLVFSEYTDLWGVSFSDLVRTVLLIVDLHLLMIFSVEQNWDLDPYSLFVWPI